MWNDSNKMCRASKCHWSSQSVLDKANVFLSCTSSHAWRHPCLQRNSIWTGKQWFKHGKNSSNWVLYLQLWTDALGHFYNSSGNHSFTALHYSSSCIFKHHDVRPVKTWMPRAVTITNTLEGAKWCEYERLWNCQPYH